MESTHLSSVSRAAGKCGAGSFSGRFMRTKRAAFQILLAKFRLDSTFSVEKRISLPGLLPVDRAKRSASAPYWAMTSSGSIPLPRDLDILRPCASRTKPWKSTVLNGAFPVYSSAEKIIRATQKKMMS